MPNKFELFEDVTSRGNDFESAAWANTLSTFVGLEQAPFITPNSQDLAYIYSSNSGTTLDLRQTIFVNSLAGKTISVGAWLKAPVLRVGGSIQVFLSTKDFVSGFSNVISSSDLVHKLLRTTHTFSTGFVDSGYGIILRLSLPNSGDTLSVWRGHSFLASENDIVIEPEFDYSQRDIKIQDMHITRGGGRFTYKWGDQFRLKFGQRFVDSQTASFINSWWNENTKLLWVVDCGLQVESVQITNKDLPIGQLILPHDTLYKGSIELETY